MGEGAQIDEPLVFEAVELARRLMHEADNLRTRADKKNRRRFGRLVLDRDSVGVVVRLTDEVVRIGSPRHASNVLRNSTKGVHRDGFGTLDFLGIRAIALVSIVFPRAVIALVRYIIKRSSRGIILPSEPRPLDRHIRFRNGECLSMNVNVLGEAILGGSEATARLDLVLEMMKRPEVNHVSVKISSIVSQIVAYDHHGSVERVAKKLRVLYRQALAEKVFVNLDMEEYRDLAITMDSFTMVLSEEEFERLDAGIVLQAYLPESHRALADLVAWSSERHKRCGSSIKVRLVKGANLAMEQTEAELHGWQAAPYATKLQTDASFLRLIDFALRPEHATAARIGVASHNLFNLAFAIGLAARRGVGQQLDIEMLEGMANGEALAIARHFGRVLLYAPVVKDDDFSPAVAYLVRRLDENTAADNYLKASFAMSPNNSEFEKQSSLFGAAVAQMHRVDTTRRRGQVLNASESFGLGRFVNQADQDLIDRSFTNKVQNMHPSVTEIKVATLEDVENVVARACLANWDLERPAEKILVFGRVADLLESQRAIAIATMMHEGRKTIGEANAEVSEAIDFVRYYGLQVGSRLYGSEPIGVVCVIPPWNFPYAIPVGGICAALASGNAVILKPAPQTVNTAWLLVNQLWEAGVPREVLQFIRTHDDEVGKALITHEGVGAVVLTGGYQTASMFTTWKPELHLLAETSGKNSIVIAASADIDLAIKDLVQSAFGHAGQKCSAASICIVDRSIISNPQFLAKLKDCVEGLVVGSSTDLATTMGPLIGPPSEALFRALTKLDDQECWLVEPRCLSALDNLWTPGVKLGVKPYSWSHLNEWFGPVLGVMVAPDLQTAVRWQNGTDYGLTAGIHALDAIESEYWVNNVQAGNLYINRPITGAIVGRQPFGGWKKSGVGPTTKAGGSNYVPALRRWDPLTDLESGISEFDNWCRDNLGDPREVGGLRSELNYVRYLPFDPLVVVVDDHTNVDHLKMVEHIGKKTRIEIRILSSGEFDLFAFKKNIARVRWLSRQTPPTTDMMQLGIVVDRRPLAQRGDIEAVRWFKEQSISITNHRYGNVISGMTPRIRKIG